MTQLPVPVVPTPEPVPGTGDDEPAAAPVREPFPLTLRQQMDSVRRTPASNSRSLLEALRPLLDRGVPEAEIVRLGFGQFPVGGYASYSHDWLFPRFGPGWRLHQGTDIFAAHGTPVRSPVDGVVRLASGGLGGTSTYVYQPDGTYFYLTHLSGYPSGLTTGQAVRTGDVVGFVGNTGNAATTPPHLHFEVHPGGGAAVDPKPYLDRFLADALVRARTLGLRGDLPTSVDPSLASASGPAISPIPNSLHAGGVSGAGSAALLAATAQAPEQLPLDALPLSSTGNPLVATTPRPLVPMLIGRRRPLRVRP